jgi:hypothetical protein
MTCLMAAFTKLCVAVFAILLICLTCQLENNFNKAKIEVIAKLMYVWAWYYIVLYFIMFENVVWVGF